MGDTLTYAERVQAASGSKQDRLKYQQGIHEGWNTLFLPGLYRQGLMLTTHEAYCLMGDPRYPDGQPFFSSKTH